MSVLLQARPQVAEAPTLSRFVAPDEAGCLIGTSTTTLYRELADSRFPALRVRGRWVIPTRAIAALEQAALECRTVVREDWDEGWSDGDQPPFFRLREAARLLTTCEATLRRVVDSGCFPALRMRSRVVVPAKAIDAMERAALETWSVVDTADWRITPGETPPWARRGREVQS